MKVDKSELYGRRKSFLLGFIGSKSILGRESNERENLFLYMRWLARSYAPTWLTRQMTKICDVLYTLCRITVERLYTDRLAKSTLRYSNASRCFSFIFVVLVLADETHVHAKHSTGEASVGQVALRSHWKAAFE